MANWTQSEAIELCRKVEAICPRYGCHVALTGGLLYKDGERKDADLLLYRIRQVKEINFKDLWDELDEIGLVQKSGFGWCYKAEYQGKPVDIFSPEEQGGEYPVKEMLEARQDGRESTARFRSLPPVVADSLLSLHATSEPFRTLTDNRVPYDHEY